MVTIFSNPGPTHHPFLRPGCLPAEVRQLLLAVAVQDPLLQGLLHQIVSQRTSWVEEEEEEEEEEQQQEVGVVEESGQASIGQCMCECPANQASTVVRRRNRI